MWRSIAPYAGEGGEADRESAGLVPGWPLALGRLVAELGGAETEADVFARLAAGLPDVLVAERVALALVDESTASLQVYAITPEPGPTPVGSPVACVGSAAAAAIDAGTPLAWRPLNGAFTESGRLRSAGLLEAVTIPLPVEGEPVGAISVGGSRPVPLGPVETGILEQVVTVAGACLRRLRRLERLRGDLERERRRASGLRMLNDIGEELQSALSEAEVVSLVARALPRVVAADRIGYARLTEDGGHLRLVDAREPGGAASPEDVVLPLRGSAIGTVFEGGSLLVLDDLREARWADTQALLEAGYASAVMIPLMAGGHTVGVVSAAARVPQRYPAELPAVLSTFARLAGATLERAWEHARRDRIEASLHQSRKLESLGVLAGGIAHDFNNLLQGVLGNASLALADLQPGDPARFAVRQIEAAAQHAATLTAQLLAYAGRRQLRTEVADVARLVGEMGDLIRSAAGETTNVVVDVPAAPCLAVVDVAQARQLVLSLVANSGEALAGKEGTVRITVAPADEVNMPRVDAVGRAVEPGEGVVILVEDDGDGMTSETAARAFEPFFTTKFAGRGLGLPWAMGVAHGHGGAIAIESTPGAGTRVVVFLPRAQAGRHGPDLPQPLDAADEGNIVLVVDDNESVVALAARILDREGYEVLSATDGTTALELFAQHGASLAAVVLDVTMPGMSGDELFLELVEHGLRAPVIVSSGFAEEEAMRKFDAKAVAGFLQKPYRAQELVELLRRAVGTRSC